LAQLLQQISPEFKLPEQFAYLKDQTISSLNVLLQLVKELYGVCKDNLVDIGSAIVHVINFYIGSKNSTNWADFSVGFVSLCLSLFRLDTVKNAAKYVQQIVGTFIQNLRTYFVVGESAEGGVKSFWAKATPKDPRSLFGIVHSCAGILTSVVFLKDLAVDSHAENGIQSTLEVLTTGLINIGSDVRKHTENITLLLGRMFDWIYINYPHILSGEFNKIVWTLPSDQVFESKFADMVNTMASILEDPLYMEANNLTYQTIRDSLYKLRAQGTTELDKSPVPSVRSCLTRYVTQIDGYIRLVENRLHPDNTKPQPMSVVLVGPAGCGKSSASTKLGLMMQKIAGNIPDQSLINNRGGDPKFEENITGSTDIIVYDDYANDRSRTMDTKEVLDIVNTSKEVIPKSRADEKGLHKYNNVGALFTTNDDNLGIDLFKTASVDSLLRRLGIVVELNIQSEYCVEGTERLDLNHPAVAGESFNTDVYDVKIKMPINVIKVNNRNTVIYNEIEFDLHEGNNMWRDAVLKLQELLLAQWESSIYRHAKSQSTENVCKECSLPEDMCMCDCLKAESSFTDMSNFKTLFYDKPLASAQERFFALDDFCIDFSSRITTQASLLIFYKNLAGYCKSRMTYYHEYRYALFGLFALSTFFRFLPLILVLSLISREKKMYFQLKELHKERSMRAGTLIRDSFRARCSAYGILFLGGAMTLSVLYRSLTAASEAIMHSEDKVERSVTNEEPKLTVKDFVDPPEKTNSDSIGYFLKKPRPASTAVSMTKAQVVAEIGKHISMASIIGADGQVSKVKCLPIGSERLIPLHALSLEGEQDILITPNASNACATYKNLSLPSSHITPLIKRSGLLRQNKQSDAALVHLPNVPPGKDFTKYFAETGTLPENCAGTYLHKDCNTGEYKEIGVRVRMLRNPLRYQTQRGWESQMVYECKAQYHTSAEGDCGQPLIYNNSIIGIHIAGCCSNVWYCLALDQSMLDSARQTLRAESSIFVSSNPAEPVFKNNLKGLYIADGETSYVTDVLETQSSPIVSLGVVVDAANQLYKPRAEDYYFRNGNKQIEVEFGERSSRPPKFVNGQKQINTTLAKFNEPKMDAPIDLMDRAVEDYLRTPTSVGKSLAEIASDYEKESPGFFAVRDLSQALDGDGTGIVRGMNNQTSSGVCYGGKKTKYLVLDELGEPVIPRQLDPVVQQDIENLETAWRAGQGTFDPFVRASKTNEVLPLKKAYEKTRSIYGNDMSFFIAATRGIIPFKHVLRNMHASECFVGLAAQSSDWEKLHDYLTNDGKYTNFVCGDFSGYDTQLPKALLEKAAAMILQVYRENGCSLSDIEYLRGFLSSVVSPVMIWEGQLLQFCSGQPSGQPLTVEMNSQVNSILMRMAFYVIMQREYPEIKNPIFREYVRLAVYGDDNALGVDSRIPKFNHTSIQAVFAGWGIKYTMAEKEADSVPYQTIDEISFLKRNFRYHEKLDAIVAPIEEESLSKKMYYWTKSKNTPLDFTEQFAANFESQAREAYLHGEEFYNEFVGKCERIRLASETGDERFVLPFNTLQPVSSDKMCSLLIGAYHEEEVIIDDETNGQPSGP